MCGKKKNFDAEVQIYPLTARSLIKREDAKHPFPTVPEKFISDWDGNVLDEYIMDIAYDFQTISDILSWISRSRGNIVRKFGDGKLASEDPSSDLQQRIKNMRTENDHETTKSLIYANNKLLERLSNPQKVEGNTVSGAERE